MADLITPADLLEYPGITEAQSAAPYTAKLIRIASGEVIDAAGSPILETRTEVTITQPPGRTLRLPGAPVRQVHSVTVDGQPVTDYVPIPGGLHRAAGWSRYGLQPVTVDYTVGLPTVPADIKDLVARMVIAGILNSEDGPEALALNNGQHSSIAIDDFKEAFATGADVEAVTEMTLPQRTRDRLAARFGGGGATVRGSW